MRPPWEQVPERVRAGVEEVLGFRVVRSESQSGGFSPGVAARVHGPEGQEAFVKAVSADVNAHSAVMHRDEARFTALLPPDHPSPRLLGSYDDGTWVALALEAVDGRPPAHPWTDADLDAAVDVLVRQSAVRAVPELPTVLETHRDELDGWRRLAAERPCLTSWEDKHLHALADLEPAWEDAATGDDWLHLDSRGDNMLVRRDGTAVLVDWPWSSRGAAVFDALAFVPAAVRDGALGVVADPARVLEVPWGPLGEACEELFARFGSTAPADDVTALLCAFAGLMQHRMRQPPPPGMPTVRAFQASQGHVACAWLARRTGWR
jgi:hypothetical protein